MLFLNKKLLIHLYCHDFAIINVIVLLDIQQTAAAVPLLSNVMTIHGTTYVWKNGKDIICWWGMVKAFILAEMAELSLNYDNGYLDILPVEFLHAKPDRVQQQLQELR